MEYLDTTLALARALTLVVVYFVLGFGPGFIIGMLIANRFAGHGKPLRMESHADNITKAAEHNKQWSPKHEKWQ